jgi:hypothetical protein
MEHDPGRARPTGAWPWVLVLIIAGLAALAAVLWGSEAVRAIWGNLWELLRSRHG